MVHGTKCSGYLSFTEQCLKRNDLHMSVIEQRKARYRLQWSTLVSATSRRPVGCALTGKARTIPEGTAIRPGPLATRHLGVGSSEGSMACNCIAQSGIGECISINDWTHQRGRMSQLLQYLGKYRSWRTNIICQFKQGLIWINLHTYCIAVPCWLVGLLWVCPHHSWLPWIGQRSVTFTTMVLKGPV